MAEENVARELPPRSAASKSIFQHATGYMLEGFHVACEVASRISGRLGMPSVVRDSVLGLFEQWGGGGLPNGLRGDVIPIVSRVVTAAFFAVPLYRQSGRQVISEFARGQSGHLLWPPVADALLDLASQDEFWSGLSASIWEDVLALEPDSPLMWSDSGRLDDLAYAIADFIDLKSPLSAAHSRRVGSIAEQIARHGLHCAERERLCIRRAGLLHDLGLVAVPCYVLNKPDDGCHPERESVRLHPTSASASSTACRRCRSPAAGRQHHEHVDGSRLLPRLRARDIPRRAHHRRRQPAGRAHAREPGHAALELPVALNVLDAEAGTILDRRDRAGGEATVAGALPRHERAWPAGLTDREVEVLRLVERAKPPRGRATASRSARARCATTSSTSTARRGPTRASAPRSSPWRTTCCPRLLSPYRQRSSSDGTLVRSAAQTNRGF